MKPTSLRRFLTLLRGLLHCHDAGCGFELDNQFAAFMADLSRDDWYGRALSVHTGLGSGTVLQCLYRLENWGWLESRWEDRDLAMRDGRPPRRFYTLTGVGQREARALLAERFKRQLRFAPGGGAG